MGSEQDTGNAFAGVATTVGDPEVFRAAVMGSSLLRVLIESVPLSVILLGAEGRVLASNRRAACLLEDSTALAQCVARAVAPAADDMRALANGIRRACAGEAGFEERCYPLRDPAFPQSLRVSVVSVGGDELVPGHGLPEPVRALITVRDPAGSRRLPQGYLRTTYGLTGAECEIATAILNGASPGQVASERGVCIETVRKQLKSIFEKTSIGGQVGLVRLMTSLAD